MGFAPFCARIQRMKPNIQRTPSQVLAQPILHDNFQAQVIRESTMFVALSKFTVANGNGMAGAVKKAFANRPHLVDEVAGFIRLDVLSPVDRPDEIWLLTYWADEASFKRWYRTHQYQAAHQNIPDGLKLVPKSTELHFFDHISS